MVTFISGQLEVYVGKVKFSSRSGDRMTLAWVVDSGLVGDGPNGWLAGFGVNRLSYTLTNVPIETFATAALLLDGTRLPVVLQPLLIFLKLFQADIAGMEVFDQNLPLVAGQARKTPSALSIFPGAGSSETKRSGVARVMQSIQSDVWRSVDWRM